MNNEILKEKINNYIEIRRNFWMALLGLSGGVTALSVSSLDNIIKTVLFVVGIILIMFVLITIRLINDEINLVIDKMKEV